MEEADVEDDPVVQEFDVFLSKGLSEQLYVFQYPVRPAFLTYDDVTHLSARVKPNQQKVELELAINTSSVNYATSKGEQIALNVDGPDSHSKSDTVFSSDVMDKQTLTSNPNVKEVSQYAVGVVKNQEIILTPLRSVVQLKPSFTYLDKADSKTKVDSGAAGDAADDEEEVQEMKPVTVRYARPESEEAKARRLASFQYLHQKQQEERWIDCQFYGKETSLSESEYRKLLNTKVEESNEFYMQPPDYINLLVPAPDLKEEEKPAMPNNVLSMTQLKTMSLNDQVRALLINAKLIRFSQLMSLLPRETDVSMCIRSLQQVAMLVQGCWIVKSEVISPKDTFSSHTGIPAEVLNRGRDFVLWRFRQSRYLVRKDLSSIIKLPAEDVKDILEQVARVRVNRGWQFLMDYDREFTDKHPDIVTRQNMLWDAKWQQLSQHFKITKEMEKKFMSPSLGEPVVPEKARRRTNSRSKSKSMSESSDADDKMDTTESLAETATESPKKRKPETNGTIEISSPTVLQTQEVQHKEKVGDFVTELTNFVREKLHTRCVITLTDLRTLLNFQIGQMSAGKVQNSSGLSDELLEHAIQSVGGTKIENQWPSKEKGDALYGLVKTGDKLDEIRALMFEMFKESPKIKIGSFKSRIEADLHNSYSETDIRRILKDYCVTKGSAWYLRGTT